MASYRNEMNGLQEFVVETVRKSGSFIAPKNYFEDSIESSVRYDLESHRYIVEIVKKFYITTDSKRFKTETNSTHKTTEDYYDTVPATITDHFKHKFIHSFFGRWRKWNFKINYLNLTHVTTNVTTIVNNITTLEYSCPHLHFPSNHQNHVIHLAQGVPDLRIANPNPYKNHEDS